MHMNYNAQESRKFKKGTYYVIAEIDWLNATVDRSFCLTSYAEGYNVWMEDVSENMEMYPKFFSGWAVKAIEDFGLYSEFKD